VELDLTGVRGFVLDIDGTLVHREGPTLHVQPGAVEVLDRIRVSGRPFALFTNGAHGSPEDFAVELRAVGLDVRDDELLTPLVSVQFYLRAHHADGSVIAFLNPSAREYLERRGVHVAAGEETDVAAVFVAHVDTVSFPELERAARALLQGAPLLTASYAPSYAGANGPIFSRGAMVTAALAKASGAQPIIVGKPSEAALAAIHDQLGVPTEEIAVIGDDVTMDVALGRLGGSRTVLVQSGTAGRVELEHIAEGQRPDAVVERVATLLEWLE
jgi:HAD superfamily hydrolase (TIGR01450 family)